VPGRLAASVLAFQYQLRLSERASPEALAAAQSVQLGAMLEHAYQSVPPLRSRLASAGLDPVRLASAEDLRVVPPMTRSDLPTAVGAPPAHHGRRVEHRTAGTTDTPLVIADTEAGAFARAALYARDHLWHDRDPAAPAAVVDTGELAAGGGFWGHALQAAFRTGPSGHVDARLPLAGQIAQLRALRPAYLLASASNLRALALECLASGVRLQGLAEACAVGAVAGPELAALCAEAWGVPASAVYAAQECGPIALQCPEAGAYHVQSEGVVLEIVDDAGLPSRLGEPGRVLITTLHNFAMPLVRYDLGDVAQAGPPCACGRTLPVIGRVLGRRRGLAHLPDGRTMAVAPDLAMQVLRPPLRDMQLVQASPGELVAHLVSPQPLDPARLRSIARTIEASFDGMLRVQMAWRPAFEPAVAARHDDFVRAFAR